MSRLTRCFVPNLTLTLPSNFLFPLEKLWLDTCRLPPVLASLIVSQQAEIDLIWFNFAHAAILISVILLWKEVLSQAGCLKLYWFMIDLRACVDVDGLCSFRDKADYRGNKPLHNFKESRSFLGGWEVKTIEVVFAVVRWWFRLNKVNVYSIWRVVLWEFHTIKMKSKPLYMDSVGFPVFLFLPVFTLQRCRRWDLRPVCGR